MYGTNYGNTRRVAKTIMEGMNEARQVEVSIRRLKEVDLNVLSGYGAVLIGSPNHMGGPTGGVKSLIDRLDGLQLGEKMFAVFDTYVGGDLRRLVRWRSE
ncbi:MAG: flavodoxin family protein [Thermoproteota archaeon]